MAGCAAAPRLRGVDQGIEHRRVPLDLLRCQIADAPVGVQRLREIELVRPRDRPVRQLRTIRRGEQARSGLHRRERIGMLRLVDPRVDEAVRMVDAQAVELVEELADPRADEGEGRARRSMRPIERRVQHAIAPGLAFGVGAARGRAHAQPGHEQRPLAPGIAVRDSDLQVAKEQEAEPPGLLPECVVLLVRDQLAEAEDRDLLSLRRAQLRPPGARIRRPQRSIRPGPAVPVLLAVERFERPVELVPLQPFPARCREAAQSFVEAPIRVRALPGRPHDARRDLVPLQVLMKHYRAPMLPPERAALPQAARGRWSWCSG